MSESEVKRYQVFYQNQVEFFELLSTINKRLGQERTSDQKIIEIINDSLSQIIPFDGISYFLVESGSFEFNLRFCKPKDHEAFAQKIYDDTVNDGTFGWALQQNRPLVLNPESLKKGCVVLHALVTPSRKWGMFIGWLNDAKVSARDISLNMLSMVLQRAALELEREELDRLLRRYNQELEHTVQKRTQELKQALNVSLKAETQFKAIYNESPDVILVVDTRTFSIIKANPAMTKLLGYDDRFLVGKPLSNLFSDKQPFSLYDLINPVRDGEVLISRKIRMAGGGFCEMDLSAGFIPWEDGRALLVVLRDATLRTQIEEERLKLSKLESLGVLAGGIAHDFNNILQIIQGNIALVQMDSNLPNGLKKNLDNAKGACERAHDLSTQLLAFSRGGEPVKKYTNMAQLIRTTADLCMQASPGVLEMDIPADIRGGEVDPQQIRQVIHQLLLNAMEASATKIHLKVANVYLDRNELPNTTDGNYIHIVVSDNGSGIKDEDMEKIFDPYFTTKSGQSGLGLTASFTIIRNHNGHMRVEMDATEGTIFHVYLPASDVKAEPAEVLQDFPAIPRQRTVRVLHMDDEELIRDVVQIALGYQGMEVVSVRDGDEVLAKYREAEEKFNPFDIVILDLTVTNGLGGKETMQQLLEINPKIQAIVCSGYSNDPIIANPLEYGFSGVLKKPFELSELGRVVENVLSHGN